MVDLAQERPGRHDRYRSVASTSDDKTKANYTFALLRNTKFGTHLDLAPQNTAPQAAPPPGRAPRLPKKTKMRSFPGLFPEDVPKPLASHPLLTLLTSVYNNSHCIGPRKGVVSWSIYSLQLQS